ncbi:MAG: group 1 truncated hemoglobin [Rhodanobacter sp.]|jgi:hemoglobin|uniref:Group 1 truncated hemoglobin n=2 Tax=Gammaproteobacteria TaxID=1236 RepID=A0A5B9E500_9GAMM|nr:group 1 truncated hemoglobin [Rhodanobacter glycinis]QEE25347.1 group 1 truncated hemoglobin [Rhodanobacter glycinis]TAM14053.1 MAG: group 1 truncated hemoglobin [Rhodanobacter sp.]
MLKHSVATALLAAGLLLGNHAAAQDTMAMPNQSAAMAASAPRDPALKPVFEEFGGKPGLVSLVNDFMDNLMADPVTHPFFANVDREHVKKELVDQFCVILDGPCTYTGRDMASVHKGMGVNRADFNALVEDLQKAMNQHKIPFRAQNKLLAKLAPMHKVIITRK